MKALVLLATALCCHATSRAVVPLVNTAGSTPMGLPYASNNFMPLMQGARPLLTSPPSGTFSKSPALLRYAALPYPTLPLGFPTMQYFAQDKNGKVVLRNFGGPSSFFNFGTPFGAPMGNLAYIGGASAAPIMRPTLKTIGTLSSKSPKFSPSEPMAEVRKTPVTPAAKPSLRTIDTLTSRPVQESSPSQSKAEMKYTPASPVMRPVVETPAPFTPAEGVRVGAEPAQPSVLFKSTLDQHVVEAPVAHPAVAAVAMPSPVEAPNPPAPSHDVPFRGGRFHTQDELGQYSFGHFGGSHTRLENKDLLGHTRGSFAYLDQDGNVHVRKYASAPGLGFTVAGSDIPVATSEVSEARSAQQDRSQKEAEARVGV